MDRSSGAGAATGRAFKCARTTNPAAGTMAKFTRPSLGLEYVTGGMCSCSERRPCLLPALGWRHRDCALLALCFPAWGSREERHDEATGAHSRGRMPCADGGQLHC